MDAEQRRIQGLDHSRKEWLRWGPYLSERQWGTVREDYSSNGDAWNYVPHDMSRSRAYRWGEDGIAGFSDNHQHICMSLAFWNGKDTILKERLFGLTGPQGNHGEDVKELYYYLDATPSHSYLKMLYKYPMAAFPYDELVDRNAMRDRAELEYEISDTGVFNNNAYYDITVEYARATPDEIVMHVTVDNLSSESARLWVLPHLWFRNTWSWHSLESTKPPQLKQFSDDTVVTDHEQLGVYYWTHDHPSEIVFTNNDTNMERLFGRTGSAAYSKDAFHEYLIHGNQSKVNPNRKGTKAAGIYELNIPAHGRETVTTCLSRDSSPSSFVKHRATLDLNREETELYYRGLQAGIESIDARLVQRQALAGMIWSKQFYFYDVTEWLQGDTQQPAPPAARLAGRNSEWSHLVNRDVISMPDKWEYPWYAAWDLAFHCIPLAQIDPEFAKNQLILIVREWYMHPNGQIPAYEWRLGDVNPPVHAWAAWRVYQIDRKQTGRADRAFLERVFHKLLLNFTWWVNRKDEDNRNVFQGGFLGLDNIGVFDRSSELAGGGHLDQADGTSWMAMYCLNMMRIAMELALENSVYEEIATKFFEHFLYIASAMNNIGGHGIGLWDENDEFYYDVLHLPDGTLTPLKVRSLVGLTPLFAVDTIEPEMLIKLPHFAQRLHWILENRKDLANLVSRWYEPGRGNRRLLSLLRGHRMKCLLRRMLDETEFLSDYGVRALSRHHKSNPYTLDCHGSTHTVEYQSAESNIGMFGGNSNWRGPIWFPTNYLIIESLQKFHHYYGDDFKIECPTGSNKYLTLYEVAEELSKRLCRIFLKDGTGTRPVFGHDRLLQMDPHCSDNILFYEYFDGDTGRGAGASHQTGWTGLIAKLLTPRSEPVH